MALTFLIAWAGIAVAQPLAGPPLDFDIDNAVGQLVSNDDAEHQWSIPAFDDGQDDGPEGAQLRLRLLKLKLKVPI